MPLMWLWSSPITANLILCPGVCSSSGPAATSCINWPVASSATYCGNRAGARSIAQQQLHHDGAVRRIRIVQRGGANNLKTEFLVKCQHSGVAFANVRHNAREPVIAGVGDLPGLEQLPES